MSALRSGDGRVRRNVLGEAQWPLAWEALLVARFLAGFGFFFLFELLLLVQGDGFIGLLLLEEIYVLADVVEVFFGGDPLAGAFAQLGEIRLDEVQALEFGDIIGVPAQGVFERTFAKFLGIVED